ncbi:DUF4232 domain-containing protein [Streptomyces sp. Go-475]|uniref:DUF4232 domain-containing protein n=1 Tax=Streptomyces sp. Go-475 TaxID=2072505 RepID=UPI000DF07CB7|nr:DUF4232 domain-containing protein [Streptomyces sp. Go-475]AXE87379.1 hypothetical protein C1703_20485 [Streptomyces sp. Go-475]
MNRRLRTVLATTVLLGAGLLTACQGGDTTSASPSGSSSAAPGSSATAGSGQGAGSGGGSGTAEPSGGGTAAGGKTGGAAGEAAVGGASGGGSGGASGKQGGASGAGKNGGTGDKSGYGQACGANDISWSVASRTQAGGYFLIQAKAKPGITCTLPAALPTVAFGSDGTEAGPAEQSVGPAITLRAGVTAYAGVNPKTTGGDSGKELDSLIVAIGDDDPNPVSLRVGTFTVDRPIVTNWHTSAADAVPFS